MHKKTAHAGSFFVHAVVSFLGKQYEGLYMNRVIFVVRGGSFPRIRELEEHLNVVSVSLFVLVTRRGKFLGDLLDGVGILRGLPTVEMFSLREFKKEMRALGEGRWGGRTTFHQRKGSFAEDRRRRIPWRRNARNR